MNNVTQFYKKLWRSRRERKIAGVCGGLAQYFKMDPSFMRIIFVFFFLFGGCVFLIYVLMWILVPLEPSDWH